MTEREERARYYEQKAAEARAKAQTMADLEAQRTMLEASDLWAGMAANAKRLPTRKGPIAYRILASFFGRKMSPNARPRSP